MAYCIRGPDSALRRAVIVLLVMTVPRIASASMLLRGAAPLISYKPGDVLFGGYKLTSFMGVRMGARHSLSQWELDQLLHAAKEPQQSQSQAADPSSFAEGVAGDVPPQPEGYPKTQEVLGKQVPLYFPPQPAGFQILDKHLGSGNFGDVWRAVRVNDSAPVVLKFMVDSRTRQHSLASEAAESVKEEYYKDCHVPNLIEKACEDNADLCPYAKHFAKCFSTTAGGSTEEPVYVAQEDAGKGCMDLEKWALEADLKNDTAMLKNLAVQLYEGLALLHHIGYAHQDVKPGNIMVRADGTLWLIDFGCANELENPQDMRIFGDMRWLGPEIKMPPPKASIYLDMWSSGLVVIYLFTGKLLQETIMGPPVNGMVSFQAMQQVMAAEQSLQMGPSYIKAVLDRYVCGQTDCHGLYTIEGSAGDNAPTMLGIMSQVFAMPPTRRATADKILEAYFNIFKAPVPATTVEKIITPPMPTNGQMPGGMMPGGMTPGGMMPGGMMPMNGGMPSGGMMPMNGGMMPMNGGMMPMNGGMMPMHGGMMPMNGGMMPMNGGMMPMNGGMMPMNGGMMPGGMMPMNGGMRPGGMMPMQGGMMPMSGGMMPMHGGMMPMNGGQPGYHFQPGFQPGFQPNRPVGMQPHGMQPHGMQPHYDPFAHRPQHPHRHGFPAHHSPSRSNHWPPQQHW